MVSRTSQIAPTAPMVKNTEWAARAHRHQRAVVHPRSVSRSAIKRDRFATRRSGAARAARPACRQTCDTRSASGRRRIELPCWMCAGVVAGCACGSSRRRTVREGAAMDPVRRRIHW
jgi:hypothetical protein